MTRQVKLVVEYDGTGLAGWQRQDNGPTVQGHLEAALASMLQAPTAVTGASRTDAGVHARGQVATFRTDKTIPLHGIRRGLNSLLPDGIAVVSAEEAPEEFHPRFASIGKHYRYLLLDRPDRSPRWRRRAWHRAGGVDVAAISAASQVLIGEHDFAAFRAAGCTAATTRRRIDRIEVTRIEDEQLVAVDVRGNAFLRHMVRIVVGTVVDVVAKGGGPGEVAAVLASRDRTQGGLTAPPWGLELMEVFYPGE